MQSREKKVEILGKYLPTAAIAPILDWQESMNFSFRIANNRKTKLGDYRPPHGRKGHRISVNKGLNKYAFLITLVHEIAHLTTFNEYKGRVAPHGREWKLAFAELMQPFLRATIFPGEVESALAEYLKNPTATSCNDEQLMRILRNYDVEPPIYLEELAQGAVFRIYNGRKFVKGPKRRKRFICEEVTTQRQYLFSPVAEVHVISTKEEMGPGGSV